MMERIGVFSLLLCGSVYMISSETLHVRQKEGYIAVLRCGRLTKGPVTWSRDSNGQRVDILTTYNGETTKHIADPDRRYSAGANLVLSIFRVSQSDAGRYDCSGAAVELTVTSGTGMKTTTTSTTEGSSRRTTQVLQNFLITVALSCLVVLALFLYLWRCLYKRKAAQNQEHFYDTIDDSVPTTQPASDQQRTKKTVYYLATHPGVQITDNQQSAYEAIYPLNENSTPHVNTQNSCSVF
ncbi:uncharacterized protein LOC119264232 [Pygocentrus nattereri]|uniref:uncharacterized protein LOC119264232 n=1 Tax=Pygocentrus nattereri TaxID=42514 RepID=UPI001891E4BE|nr:uncharacterized protein LOC119264232 [Pygocentrus nattereri]